MKNKFNREDLIDLLIKKASGFYYSEEQYEYEKTQKKFFINEKHCENVSFFEKYDRGESLNKTNNDTIKSSNEIAESEEKRNLTLIKKKVSTHYVSPDIHAIKILFEIFEKKVGEDSLENLTDEELLNLKNTILKELSNEINDNK